MKLQNTETARIRIAAANGFRTAVAAVALIVAGCGGGGGGGNSPVAVDTVQPPAAANAFTVTGDSYGMQSATYLSSTKSTLGLVLRAAIATSMTDPDFRTVARIDIPNPAAVSAGTVYALGAGTPGLPAFPGTVYFFNGHPSSLLQTTGGTISFTSYGTGAGQTVAGSFSADILDGSDSAIPKGSYTVSADFSFGTGSSAAVSPAPSPVPAGAAESYSAGCASCHTLGSLDTAAGSGGEVGLKGGKLGAMFPSNGAGHQGIALSAAQVTALKVLLNAN